MKITFERVSYSYVNDQSDRGLVAGNRLTETNSPSASFLALEDVSCVIEEATVSLLAGHNGSGKSTFLKLMNGILKPCGGTVILGDIPTADRKTSELARYCSLCFQNPDDQLFAATVEKEIRFGLENIKSNDSLYRSVLQILNLTELLKSNPFALTYAQKRIVAIAACVAMDTPIVALDEPTAGLSMREKENLKGLLEFLKSRGKTIVIVSHDLEFFLPIADDVVLLSKGRIRYAGGKNGLFGKGNSRVVFRESGVNYPVFRRIAEVLGLEEPSFDAKAIIDELSKKRAGTTLRTNG
ncbi:MAG TPA: ABC transporter ATP-binding protein [Candidatus Kryptonia bacterium]